MAENKNQTPEPTEAEVVKSPGFIRTSISKHPRAAAALAGVGATVGGFAIWKLVSSGSTDASDYVVEGEVLSSTVDAPASEA